MRTKAVDWKMIESRAVASGRTPPLYMFDKVGINIFHLSPPPFFIHFQNVKLGHFSTVHPPSSLQYRTPKTVIFFVYMEMSATIQVVADRPINNNNNETLILRHNIMQMQTQQRTPLSNRSTRNETSVSSAYS